MQNPQTITYRLPPDQPRRSRVQYVVEWLQQHPYKPEQVSFAASESGRVDLAALTQATAWLRTKLSSVDLDPSAVSWPKQSITDFDWVSPLFYVLSMWSEWTQGAGDADPAQAFLARHDLARRPAADLLAKAVLEHFGVVPEISASTLIMTHDLDHVRLFQRPWSGLRFAQWATTVGGTAAAYSRVLTDQWKVLRGKRLDPFDNAQETLGTGGILYLLLGRTCRQDGGRDRTDERLADWIAHAQAHGYHLGLHPSYQSTEQLTQLRAEVERFTRLVGKAPRLTRQHFLRWNWRRTPQQLVEAGLTEDSSLGYRDRLGFRCGTSFPYRLYDFSRERAFDLRARPLAIMDVALLRGNGYAADAACADLNDFAQKNAKGAELTTLVHNSMYYHGAVAGFDVRAGLASLKKALHG